MRSGNRRNFACRRPEGELDTRLARLDQGVVAQVRQISFE